MQKWGRGNAGARYFGDGYYIGYRVASVGNIVARGDPLLCLNSGGKQPQPLSDDVPGIREGVLFDRNLYRLLPRQFLT